MCKWMREKEVRCRALNVCFNSNLVFVSLAWRTSIAPHVHTHPYPPILAHARLVSHPSIPPSLLQAKLLQASKAIKGLESALRAESKRRNDETGGSQCSVVVQW